ncbi:hypothetical protein [Myroides odoratimimus]|uniref:HNH endonuclease n=1 Tax=Myroides odoratimimus TaxID=76832 RepID=UPI0031010032
MIPLIINNQFAENHYNSIKNALISQINRILNDGGINKRPRGQANYKITYSNTLQTLLQEFANDPDTYLKPLIVKSPDDINTYVSDLNHSNSDYINSNHDDNMILYNLFVNSIYDNTDIFNKWNFINKINLSTCPYCNRNYIYTTTKSKTIKPEIDHFYPKHKYPILAISYFNLIPSCSPCNGISAKHQKDPFHIGLVNPYLLKNNDFVFTHKIKNIAILNPLSEKSDVEIQFKKAYQGHLDLFNLKQLYELHHDHALELIIKKRLKYSKKYRDYLNSYNGLKFSQTDIDHMILGNYALQEEQHKRPLAKLYQDIGKELGLI